MRLIEAYWQTLAPTPAERAAECARIEAELNASYERRKEQRQRRSEPAHRGHSTRIHNAFTKARNMMGEG